MALLNKLPGSRREPPGLEWTILRRLPVFVLAGTMVPVLFALAAQWWPPALDPVATAKHLTQARFLAIGAVITAWTAAFTVAIGCVTVVLMKGPAYVADAYELQDDPDDEPR